jgi:hypothetical protein
MQFNVSTIDGLTDVERNLSSPHTRERTLTFTTATAGARWLSCTPTGSSPWVLSQGSVTGQLIGPPLQMQRPDICVKCHKNWLAHQLVGKLGHRLQLIDEAHFCHIVRICMVNEQEWNGQLTPTQSWFNTPRLLLLGYIKTSCTAKRVSSRSAKNYYIGCRCDDRGCAVSCEWGEDEFLFNVSRAVSYARTELQ